MSVTPQVTYPGVYIQEVPSGVRTITGVATSIAAFVGYTQRGPTNKAVQIFNFGDFERQFGGLNKDSDVSYAVHQFFLNGGSNAWIVRVAKGASKASVDLKNGVNGGAVTVLEAKAISEGLWGNMLRLSVDYDTSNPASLFNLTVTELVEQSGILQPTKSEVHRNLSMNSFSSQYVVDMINAGSQLIQVTRPLAQPIHGLPSATSSSGTLTLADLAQLNKDHRMIAITIDGDGPYEFAVFDPNTPLQGTLTQQLQALATNIQTWVQNKKPLVNAFKNFICNAVGSQIESTGGTDEQSNIRFSNASMLNAASVLKLGVSNGGTEQEAAAGIRPVQTGTIGTSLAGLIFATLAGGNSIDVTIKGGASDVTVSGLVLWSSAPNTLEGLRGDLAKAFASSGRAELNQATVALSNSCLRIVAGGSDPNVRLEFSNSGGGADTTAATIGLTTPTSENVAQYALGIGSTAQAQTSAVPGDDGGVPTSIDIEGDQASKTGIYALEDVDLFNLLCIPNASDPSLLSQALDYVVQRRAFLIMDFPADINTVPAATGWLAKNNTLRSTNAAIYFPRTQAADPLQNNILRSFPTCGIVAGLYARTDASRGVWKAPAGTDATIQGVQGLDYTLTDQENGVLNPLAVNCLRNFPVYGEVIWGARTLQGADVMASEWKYVPVRRLALFLEETLYRGTKWVVFEPNDEPLWAQIRLNIGAFMQSLFRQGAFQGKTPKEAYFVKCDNETTTDDDRNRGIVNILVGFAPLKPAEFVVIKISQIAGQIQT